MVIYCLTCGAELPDGALFCWQCGRSPRGDTLPLWEYHDVTIPLNVRVSTSAVLFGMRWDEVGAPQANQIIVHYLQRAAQDGWGAEGITDFAALARLGHVVRVEWPPNDARGWLVGDTPSGITYVSVTVRLKRLARG